MKQVTRFDVGEFRASVNDDGYLEDTPVVGRVGIQEYVNPDGSIRRELRPPDEVFDADSLASFKGKPITLGHPGHVNAKNAKKFQVGTIMDAANQDGDRVRVPIMVHADEAINQAKRGRAKQLSLGYLLYLDETPGVWNGQPYDAIQRNIRINHLALVPKARAGGVATLNLDGDEVFNADDDDNNQPKGKEMQKIRLDSGLEYDAAPEVAVAYQALKQDAADAANKLADAETKITTLTAERDTLKADASDFEAKLVKAREDAAQEIKARIELEAQAARHGIKCDGLDDIAVKKAVIGKLKPGINLDGKNDTYIGVAFDMSVESAPMARQRQTANQDKAEFTQDEKPPSAKSAREKMIANMHGKGTQ